MVAKHIFFFILVIIQTTRAEEKNDIESADNSFGDSNSTLMAVGSYISSFPETLEIFDLRNEKWVEIDNFKCKRGGFSSVLLENKVILIGGDDGNYNVVNTVQSYDLNTGAIENLPPMKYGRTNLAAVEFKGLVYAIGGWDDGTSLPYVEMWDPTLKKWTTLTSMTIERRGCRAAVLDEEIIVVGGNNGEYPLTVVESYNPVTDQWRKRASMNQGREHAGVAVVGKYVYAVGGKKSYDDYLNTVERFDPETDEWTMIRSLNQTRYAMGTADFFGKLVIVGGDENGNTTSTMEMYDDESDNWTTMPSLNELRLHFDVVKIPWKLAETTL